MCMRTTGEKKSKFVAKVGTLKEKKLPKKVKLDGFLKALYDLINVILMD